MTDDDAKRLAAAIVDVLLERLTTARPPADQKPRLSQRYMKVIDYASYSGFSRSTIQEYIKRGMPAVRTGKRGHKVDVKAADEWLRLGGAAMELHS